VTSPARSAGGGLVFSSEADPGIARLRSGRGFRYIGPTGRPIRDSAVLDRIRALAIPPAWTDVWICRDHRGHLQAVGRDARGRKQPRYHATWRARRDDEKFARLATFGRALPAIRRRVDRDLRRPDLSRERVLATVVRLLEVTYLRIGNEEYARSNRSFGLTTLRDRHVAVGASVLRFRFRGKGGKTHTAGVRDRRLARVVARCQDLPGQELFQYLDDDGEPRPIESVDVNDYIREAAGIEVTAKDFRTWAGTLLAFRTLRASRGQSKADTQASLKRSIDEVAEALGNTPAVSRQSYIAPAVVRAHAEGTIPRAIGNPDEVADKPVTRREELALVRLLEELDKPPAKARPRNGARRRPAGAD
jgi:DNA topoisomerase-1